MPKTRLYLVRHGETNENKSGVFQGQHGTHLNTTGREQAAKLAARLARHSFAALYTSDLLRARQTADAVGAALGLTPVLEEELREINLGTWQGLSIAEISARFPEEWAAWRAGAPDLRRGGGETYAELAARVTRAMGRIADAHPHASAVVVSHGAALKTFAGEVLGMSPGSAVWLRSFRVQGNTGVSIVDREDDGGWKIVVWNDTAHLTDGGMFEAP
jgi:broad specificity phosphatase PhoE